MKAPTEHDGCILSKAESVIKICQDFIKSILTYSYRGINKMTAIKSI